MLCSLPVYCASVSDDRDYILHHIYRLSDRIDIYPDCQIACPGHRIPNISSYADIQKRSFRMQVCNHRFYKESGKYIFRLFFFDTCLQVFKLHTDKFSVGGNPMGILLIVSKDEPVVIGIYGT